MSDPWSQFPDSGHNDADPWSAFPDASRKRTPPPRKPRMEEPPQTAPGPATPVDGDTLDASGNRVRVFGIDAPELKQNGWDREGHPVPIGQQSKQAMSDIVLNRDAVFGPRVGESYGRAVEPLSVDGEDVGQQQVRSGNALAAPDYLSGDPERRFQYVQAERLARQNRLGLHDTFTQTPKEFRQDPSYVPDRETVAQFWDTPTPEAGMTKEAEQQLIALARTGTADQMMALAEANGFRINPADALAIVKARDASKGAMDFGVSYRETPKVMTDQGDGKSGAAARGLANGVLPNFLEETGAVVDMLGGTSDRENVWNSDRRLADIYANNAAQNEAITRNDMSAHPYVTTGAQIAGGLVLPMGKVTSAADLAKWGAGYGFASGFGQEGTIPERLTSGTVGAGEGVATTVLGTKALEAAAPYIDKGLRYAAGKMGVTVPAPRLGDPQGIPPRQRDVIDLGAPDAPAGPVETPRLDTSRPIPRPGPSGRMSIADELAAWEAKQQEIPGAQDLQQLLSHGVTPAEAARQLALRDPRRALPMANDNPATPSISSDLPPRQRDYILPMDRPQQLSQPLSSAQVQARAAEVEPRDVLPIPSNQVSNVEEAAAIEAGRYGEVKPPNERDQLTRQTVRAWNGAEVPKVGPIDLVGWLRLRGGIADQGDELSHMGLTNAARKMDFAGQEQRFGPLVSDQGMTLDDAAMRAWEAGYFPDLTDRPTVNEFLDALRSTHEGRTRNFLPEDLAEIDRYHAAQAESYAIKEQRFESGQPVMQDRSVPADEPQPFPPPQAYEEWPAGGPDFAGNIDLRKLESPQDIGRALDFTHRQLGGFDAATRGRISHAETERLASDLGMTPDQLLSRRRGQPFNAEEALGARQILAKSGNELVNLAKRVQSMDNPGDDLMAEFQQTWTRHAAIQEQVAGMTAEAGRTLQQFRMLADSRNVGRDVLTAIVNNGGGPQRIKQAADIILDAVEHGPGKFNTVIEKASKPRFRDKLVEVYINSLLTNPATHVVNMTSNTLTALAQLPEHAAAAVIGKTRQALPGANVDRVLGSELGARTFGMLQGVKEGARYFAQTLRTGEPVDLVSKVENQNFKAVSGLKGEVVRLPTRFLAAEDELFKGIARRSELWGLAARQAHREGLKGQAAATRMAELTENPPDELLSKSMDFARYVTFQQKLGPAMSKVSGFTQDIPAMKLFLPFVRTPTNLLKFAVERSPAAPLLKEWRADFMAGGARRDLAVAKATLGTGFAVTIYQAAQQGMITGSPPTDPAKARLLYADGWQPYSIRVGDKWVSYKRMDPFSTTIGTAADLALLPEGMSERQKQDQATLLIASIMGNLASKTWLSGMSGLVSALTEPDRKANDLLQRVVGGVTVPAGVAQAARTLDPVQRDTDSVGEAVQARIPGLSSSLPPRRDVWGEKVTSEGGIGPDMLSPAYVSTAKDDPVNRELLKAGISVGIVPAKVGGQHLTREQHQRYQMEAGTRSHDGVRQLVTSPGWAMLDDDAKKDAVEKAVKSARADARAVLFKSVPAPRKDAWGAFPDAGPKVPKLSDAPRVPANDPWSAFKDPEQRDVLGNLMRIPGLSDASLTSGYRTKEYQAEMRRRGYKPADNSGHLDGSSLDIIVPPRRSMNWLMGQVKQVEPSARFYPEGDHLHATFPGWYGAPVLGGAKRAGLRNPNSRLPAPRLPSREAGR